MGGRPASRARTATLPIAALILFTLPGIIAAVPAHAPSLSVHESCYGTSVREGHCENIQGLEIGIVSRRAPGTSYRVECFFLKRGKNSDSPSVDDVVVFEITDPHAVYRVMAKPIRTGTSPSLSRVRTSGKKSHVQKLSAPRNLSPREGFLVRILSDGAIVREYCSSHSVERLAAEDPELFTKALAGKKARGLESQDIQVR